MTEEGDRGTRIDRKKERKSKRCVAGEIERNIQTERQTDRDRK